MKFKKQFISIVIVFTMLCANSLFAQKNNILEFEYEPGYVVNNRGDTLRGLIKYARQYELSLRVYFHDEKTREPQILHPFTIRSYFVHNETYESKIYDYAPERPDGFAVFMRRLNTGACRVYEYWNSDQIGRASCRERV